MAAFKHLLLTHFNLLSPGAELDDAWYEQRFELFEQFCLPSVRAQTNQSFHWLLFADRRTPQIYRPRLEGYESTANVHVYWLAGRDLVGMAQHVRSHLGDSASHLITTSLDNDDGLGREFVAQVQAQFTGQRFELINLLHGLRYDLQAEKLYACELEANPFVSLIEEVGPSRQFRSITGCLPHSLIKERFSQIKNVNTTPLWLQVIHGRNVAPTGTWGRPRVPTSQLASFFELDYDVPRGAGHEGSFRAQHARARLERRVINGLSRARRQRLKAWLHRRMID